MTLNREGVSIFNLKQNEMDPRQLGPIALAFIGDGVYELLVRERLVQKGSLPAHKLHRLAVEKVRASAQAAAYEAVEAALNEEEWNILKRGRNAHTSNVPKSCTPEEYHKATAIEALLGYLYLKGRMERIAELYDLMNSI